jgi:hypothetical protein
MEVQRFGDPWATGATARNTPNLVRTANRREKKSFCILQDSGLHKPKEQPQCVARRISPQPASTDPVESFFTFIAEI